MPTDEWFHAVCGIQRQNVAADEDWFVEGSGTFVTWTNGQGTHYGIVSARHFIDDNGSAGACVGSNTWYAYFLCPEVGPNPPCMPICVGPNETEWWRVPITCFTLPDEEFAEFCPGPDKDGVVVGTIDSGYLELLLCFFTPMQIKSPIEAGVCRGESAYIAGWGFDCNDADANALRAAMTTIDFINCKTDGRGDAFPIVIPSASCGGACVPGPNLHDSGGAIAVEGPDDSLVLVGVLSCGYLIAVRHQFFSDPESSEFLCQPCRPRGCVNMTQPHDPPYEPPDGIPDGVENSVDRAWLEAWLPHEVNCRCMGDLNGNGCAGDAGDLALMSISGAFGGVPCTTNKGCYGDADTDGVVDEADLTFISAILEANNNESLDCATCSSCVANHEWCQGDINCDGVVDENDYALVYNLLAANDWASFPCTWNAPGCLEEEATLGCP
ncbi:MAG: hypothetical protein JNK58_07975 [Phycisphaerae bacterium]|nr:hypothetical protein [Phycisphaerae bacterium]